MKLGRSGCCEGCQQSGEERDAVCCLGGSLSLFEWRNQQHEAGGKIAEKDEGKHLCNIQYVQTHHLEAIWTNVQKKGRGRSTEHILLDY